MPYAKQMLSDYQNHMTYMQFPCMSYGSDNQNHNNYDKQFPSEITYMQIYIHAYIHNYNKDHIHNVSHTVQVYPEKNVLIMLMQEVM